MLKEGTEPLQVLVKQHFKTILCSRKTTDCSRKYCNMYSEAEYNILQFLFREVITS